MTVISKSSQFSFQKILMKFLTRTAYMQIVYGDVKESLHARIISLQSIDNSFSDLQIAFGNSLSFVSVFLMKYEAVMKIFQDIPYSCVKCVCKMTPVDTNKPLQAFLPLLSHLRSTCVPRPRRGYCQSSDKIGRCWYYPGKEIYRAL